jgi:hypothetical protein
LLGYHSLKTITFLKNRRHDLFMEAKAFWTKEEVVVANNESLLKRSMVDEQL